MASKLASVTAEVLLPGNTYRKSLAIQNEDTVDSLFIKRERSETPTVSATDHDWKIGPGGSISLNSMMDGIEAIQDRFSVVASANTPRVAFFETEDVKR